MQSPISRRRVATAAPPATPVAGAAALGPPLLRFTLANGMLEIEDAVTTVRLLEAQQRDRLAAEAEQSALSNVYRLSGKLDPARPYGGLVTKRLDISERTAYELIRSGRLRYTCAGAKNYRISEAACREFLGDIAA
jgi:excisionase family DNA binding protein